MSFKDSLVRSVSSAVAKSKFVLQKNSPEITLAAGILAGVGCVVLTVVASVKAVPVVNQCKEDVGTIKEECYDEANVEVMDACNKEIATVYVHTGLALAKLYAPALLAGAVSIGSILVSHRLLTKRNAAIGAALLTVTEGFKEYRDRVRNRFGEDVEKEIRYDIHDEEVERVEIDPVTGKKKKIKETVKVSKLGESDHSVYAKIFDEFNTNWSKDSEYNRIWLQGMQARLNDLLIANGYVFLNDVYDTLGFPKTQAGQVVGWKYKPNDPKHKGANFVDFGMFDTRYESRRDFVNGYERSIILDFNVDGDIWTDSPFAEDAKRKKIKE